MHDLRKLVGSAISALLREDGGLLRNNVGEQAITHRLAVHLSLALPDWHVDCEYNRDMETVKRLKFALSDDGDVSERAVVPDIIVHHRETTDNLLVIEVKKSTNPEPDEVDLQKLKAFREQLGYEHAVFFRFAAGDQDPRVVMEKWVNDA